MNFKLTSNLSAGRVILVVLLMGVIFLSTPGYALYHDADVSVDTGSGAEIDIGGDTGISSGIDVRTGFNASRVENETKGSLLRVTLSNGQYAYVKILPEVASEIAVRVLNASCQERNCTVELKETGYLGEIRAVYRVHAEKDARVLGIFRTTMNVSADVDAETGEIIEVNKPWWAFIASETNVSS
ncbi:hypothetical protein HYZ97_01470 [Candidatus Pacearchaeota archaeon]|nr:hypothetical protein [Candidatus Pacearchaeota archaeon]